MIEPSASESADGLRLEFRQPARGEEGCERWRSAWGASSDDPIVALADVWESGGPVASVDQGGDATPPWQLEPRARGLKVLDLEMMPTDTGPGSGDEGWHATDTIDVDIVIDGAVELYLPELPRSACPLATFSYSEPRTTAGVPPETVTCEWSPS